MVASALAELRAALDRLVGAGAVWFASHDVVQLEGHPDPVPLGDAIGVMDPTTSRCAFDLGEYAVVFDRGAFRGGPSGEPLTDVGEEHRDDDDDPPQVLNPLMLVQLAEHAVSATVDAEETVGEDRCRLFRVVADATGILATTPTAAPEWFDDPVAAPLDVCIAADGTLRRLRWTSAYAGLTCVVDVLADPVDPGYDWQRYPDWKGIDEDELAAAQEEWDALPRSPVVTPQPELDRRLAEAFRGMDSSDAQRFVHDHPILVAELASRSKLEDPAELADPSPDLHYLVLWLIEHGDMLHDGD